MSASVHNSWHTVYVRISTQLVTFSVFFQISTQLMTASVFHSALVFNFWCNVNVHNLWHCISVSISAQLVSLEQTLGAIKLPQWMTAVEKEWIYIIYVTNLLPTHFLQLTSLWSFKEILWDKFDVSFCIWMHFSKSLTHFSSDITSCRYKTLWSLLLGFSRMRCDSTGCVFCGIFHASQRGNAELL